VTITFTAIGQAFAKGSHTAISRGGRAFLIEGGSYANRKGAKAWARYVEDAAALVVLTRRLREPISAPVNVAAVFYVRRPASRKKAAWPDVRPDLDKLVRAVLDPIVAAGLLKDDSLVVGLDGTQKRYIDAAHPEPGVVVTITTL